MSVSDPIGDMLTRIRNAVGRKKTKVSTPASKLRARVLDVLQSEGYIRGYTQSEFVNGKAEIEIELKYYEGVPVIRELTRVSKPAVAFTCRLSRSRRLRMALASRSCPPLRV